MSSSLTEEIWDVAGRGYFYLVWRSGLDIDTRTQLIKDGYDVSSIDEGETLIRWSDPGKAICGIPAYDSYSRARLYSSSGRYGGCA
jgi:hypothetical protein